MNKPTGIDACVRLEVTDAPLIPGRSGVKDGKPWTIPTKQVAWLWQGDPYPTKIEIPSPESGPYRPGFYLLAGTPFKVGVTAGRVTIQFDDRAVSLVPVEALDPAKQAKAA